MLLLLGVIAWHVANLNLATCLSPNVTANTYAESTGLFGQSSFKVIYKNEPGNIIYSPAGASMALLMLGDGDKGKTMEQIFRCLRVPIATTRRDLFNFVKDLNNTDSLRMANKLFHNNDFTPNKTFVFYNKKIFESLPQGLDFARSDEASKLINGWSANETGFAEVVEPDDINEDIEILLANVMHVKSDWETPFNPLKRSLQKFYPGGNYSQNVPTMMAVQNFSHGYTDKLNASWIELPFRATNHTQPGDALSMLIFLPSGENLDNLVENFDKVNLTSFLGHNGTPTKLLLPKFTVNKKIDIRRRLQLLGFTDMFTKNANFSGIVEGRQLSVDRFFQKAIIEVDENSSQSGVDTKKKGTSISTSKNFAVDHPFLALIMKRDGTLLFIAAIRDLRNEEDAVDYE